MKLIDLILAFLLTLNFVSADQVQARRVRCRVRLNETNMTDDMVPAVITPKNYARLVCALKCCRIEKAEVAGWNDHKGVYVLYDNGAVVPGEELTIPNYALYERTDRHCRTEVILVINFRLPNGKKCYRIVCKTKDSGMATCNIGGEARAKDSVQVLRPCPTMCMESVSECNPAIECQTYECNPIICTESASECNPTIECQTYECLSSKNEGGYIDSCQETEECCCGEPDEKCCQVKMRRTKERSEDRCAITDKMIESGTKFVFKKSYDDYRLVVYQKKVIDKKIAFKPSDNHLRLKPKILACPKLLKKVLKQAHRKVGSGPCLYITMCSKIFILADGKLYKVSLKNGKIRFKPLSSKWAKKIRSSGLYLVEFNE